MFRPRTTESGSVIIWIFVLAGLIAALSMAVSRVNRGGSGENLREMSRLRVTDVMQYASTVQRAVRIMLLNGVDESELCFHTVQWGHTDYEHTPACTAAENLVFGPEGGEVSFQDGLADWYDAGAPPPASGAQRWVYSARFEVGAVGTDSGGAGTNAASADLLMATAPVGTVLCETLNTVLGYDPPAPPAVAAGAYDDLATLPFTGTFADDPAGRIAALGRERCVADPDGFNFYYKVILAR